MKSYFYITLALLLTHSSMAQRQIISFNKNWQFVLGDTSKAWRTLSLPHDWSIEGAFSESNPATNAGGSLPGGIGWYRKTFTLPANAKGKQIHIEFDGIY